VNLIHLLKLFYHPVQQTILYNLDGLSTVLIYGAKILLSGNSNHI